MQARALTHTRVATRDYDRLGVELADGARTTLHLASFDRAAVGARVVRVAVPRTLLAWCRAHGQPDAIVGGFFVRPRREPLGELRIQGETVQTVPFDSPWHAMRSCVHIAGDGIRVARRHEIGPAPVGDLLQAGPLLVSDGKSAIQAGRDPEGFSAGAHQFDSDITRGRYPRAALALAGSRVLAAVCDGRADGEAGLTLAELADTLVELGAEAAINLDGGGSASLVQAGRLRNRPREEHGIEILGGRPIATAIVFD
jgi:Phosphodiester glycosidase